MSQTTLRTRNNAAVRKYRYGISQEQYDALLEEQNNSCAVCLRAFDDSNKPRLDHDRNCCPSAKTCGNCMRGILCGDCIAFARYIETRFDIIEDMFKYLRVHLERRTPQVTGGER